MNKILLFLLLILFLVIAYIIFDFQVMGLKKLSREMQKERQLRGAYYCEQIVRELEYLPNLDAEFLKFIERITKLQPDEIVEITLKNNQEYYSLWRHPNVSSETNINSYYNLCIKSQNFKFRNLPSNILVYLQPSSSIKALNSIELLLEKLTVLLITIVFLTALFMLYVFYKRSEQEKQRIASEMRQQELASQTELDKREQKAKEMKELIYTQENQLRHADKMNSIGTLASGMVHEVNNPNSYIALNAVTLEKAWRDALEIINHQIDDDTKIAGIPYKIMRERIPTLTQAIKEGSERIRHIVADFKQFSSSNQTAEAQQGPINVKIILDTALRLTNHFLLKHTDHLIVENTIDCFVLGYAQRLEQVLVNLLINSAQSLSNKEKKIQVKTHSQEQNILIEISDEGCGIPQENIEKIFEPFFTTKTESNGTGLGLSISNAIIHDMRGVLKVQSASQMGTCFTIILPRIKAETLNEREK